MKGKESDDNLSSDFMQCQVQSVGVLKPVCGSEEVVDRKLRGCDETESLGEVQVIYGCQCLLTNLEEKMSLPGAVSLMHRNPSHAVQTIPKIHCPYVPYPLTTSVPSVNFGLLPVRSSTAAPPLRGCFFALLDWAEASDAQTGMSRWTASCEICARFAYRSNPMRRCTTSSGVFLRNWYSFIIMNVAVYLTDKELGDEKR